MIFKLNRDKKQLDLIVRYLKELEKDCMVKISDPNRTIDQNNLFHSNIDILANHAGYTKEEMKCVVKKGITQTGKLNMWHRKEGKLAVDVYKSTADLTTKEWGVLMEYIYQLGSILQLHMIYSDLVEEARKVF